jgi:quercetin dioxygenase-like cupin family protein
MSVMHWDSVSGDMFTEASLKKKLQKAGYAVYRYVYSPGTSFPVHAHSIDKVDAVVTGTLKITIDEGEFLLRPGDMLVIAAGVKHSAEVVGSEPVVILDGCRDS